MFTLLFKRPLNLRFVDTPAESEGDTKVSEPTTPAETNDTNTANTGNDTKQADDDKPLEAGGLKALQAERERVKELKRKVAELEAAKPDANVKVAERLAELESQLAATAKEAAVYRLTAQHNLSDEHSALLADLPVEQMDKFAAALAGAKPAASTNNTQGAHPNFRLTPPSATTTAGRDRFKSRNS
jgi:hypothetical protein